jgi:hypothetical protein
VAGGLRSLRNCLTSFRALLMSLFADCTDDTGEAKRLWLAFHDAGE